MSLELNLEGAQGQIPVPACASFLCRTGQRCWHSPLSPEASGTSFSSCLPTCLYLRNVSVADGFHSHFIQQIFAEARLHPWWSFPLFSPSRRALPRALMSLPSALRLCPRCPRASLGRPLGLPGFQVSVLLLCLPLPVSGFLSLAVTRSPFTSPLWVSLPPHLCASRLRRVSRFSPPLQINKPSPPPPPLSQGRGAGVSGAGALILSARPAAWRSPSQAQHGAGRDGAEGAEGRGVSAGTRRPMVPAAATRIPGARAPRRAHVVGPRLLGRAARSLGGARRREDRISLHPCFSTPVTVHPASKVGAGI